MLIRKSVHEAALAQARKSAASDVDLCARTLGRVRADLKATEIARDQFREASEALAADNTRLRGELRQAWVRNARGHLVRHALNVPATEGEKVNA